MVDLDTRKAYQTFRAWLLSPRSLVSIRCALTFCTGTLFCMLPNYPTAWFSALSLADQISFTLLGGVSKPVGGCWDQIFNRLGGGIVFGTPCYVLLALLGKQYTIQGIVFAIFVFLLSWVGSYSKFVGSGALFAQTACVYAVTNSYRPWINGTFDLKSLWDLLLCWVTGAVICLFYNLAFFPSFASSELLDQLDASLDNVQHAVDFLYSERECGFEARDINDKLTSDMDRSAVLLQQASWEIAHQAGEWEEHRAVVETLDKLRVILFTSVLDRCAYRMLKPDTARILRQPVADCHKAFSGLLTATKAGLRGKQVEGIDAMTPLKAAQTSFAAASTSLTDKMLLTLSDITTADADTTSHLYVATHCVTLAGPLADHLQAVHASVALFSSRPKHWQFRVLKGVVSFKTYLPNRRLLEVFMHSTDPKNAFLPTPSIAQRVMRMMTTDQAIGALKIVIALLAMLSILWADETRTWFLNRNIQTATVPLILALMPTLGGSMIAWIAELFGTFSGAVWGFVTMLVWRNRGGAAYSVPGVVLFQLLYTLCLSWRLAWGCDDMLAVLGCFALGAYINKEYQIRHDDPPPSLPLQLGSSAIVICIAIGIAIPMQFLVMRKSARQSGRLALADSMRDVGEVHEKVGKLFTHLLLDEQVNDAQIASETSALRKTVAKCRGRLLSLRGYVKEAQAEWGVHDGWLAERYIRQIAACHRMLASCDIAARVLSMGLFHIEVLNIIRPHFATVASDVSSSSASVLWCHAAALSLLRPLPGTLPSVEATMRSVLLEVEQASRKARELDTSDNRIESDLRRFWQLSDLLISQGSMLEELENLLHVDWKPSKEEEAGVEMGELGPTLSRKDSQLMADVEKAESPNLIEARPPLPAVGY